MRYMQTEIPVQAFQFTADAEVIAPDWFGAGLRDETIYIDRSIKDGAAHVYGCTISTPHGNIRARIGDYIIREPDGSLFVRSKKRFEEICREVQ